MAFLIGHDSGQGISGTKSSHGVFIGTEHNRHEPQISPLATTQWSEVDPRHLTFAADQQQGWICFSYVDRQAPHEFFSGKKTHGHRSLRQLSLIHI